MSVSTVDLHGKPTEVIHCEAAGTHIIGPDWPAFVRGNDGPGVLIDPMRSEGEFRHSLPVYLVFFGAEMNPRHRYICDFVAN